MVRDHKNRLICRIDVMGFVAIMVALLFIFIGDMQPHRYGRVVSVDLAKVLHSKSVPRADREDAITVAIQRDGKIFFGTDPVIPDRLATEIRQAVDAGADPRVYLRTDARARYANVKLALDGVRDARIDRVTFIVEDVRR